MLPVSFTKISFLIAFASIAIHSTAEDFPDLDKLAAAEPICGGGDTHQVEKFKHIPIRNFHGAKDDAVPVERSTSMIRALKDAGEEPMYREYKKVGHDSCVKAYAEPDLLPRLFAQKGTQ